jgi:predicted ABC-type ATPase
MAVFGDEAMERAYSRVEREALSGTQARERPTAILIGGQPGAGKSVLARQATEDLRPLGGSVLIDADRMRENNPAYHRLARENPAAAADLTHAEAGRWSVRLTNAAMDTQRNVVIDGTMRNPENLRLLVSRLKDRGYFVEVRGIAMHSDVSLARAQLRFEREYAVTGAGRAVTASQHDQAYAGMLRTVALLEREKAVDAVRI